MSTVTRFENLDIWILARQISKNIYNLTINQEFRRDYSLTDQIRRSSGSIMDNIAEGYERDGQKEFIQFLSISKGSAGETRSQLYRTFDHNFISEEQLNELNTELLKLSTKIQNFINYLKKSQFKGHKYK
jgi:four helix bundle protein